MLSSLWRTQAVKSNTPVFFWLGNCQSFLKTDVVPLVKNYKQRFFYRVASPSSSDQDHSGPRTDDLLIEKRKRNFFDFCLEIFNKFSVTKYMI